MLLTVLEPEIDVVLAAVPAGVLDTEVAVGSAEHSKASPRSFKTFSNIVNDANIS